MTNNQENIERDLRLLKKAITPSPDLVRRVAAVTHIQPPRYTWYPMAISKFLIPAAAVAVVAIAIIGFRNRGPVMVPLNVEQNSRISTDDLNNIIASLFNDANAEQSIANEADAEAAFMDDDRAAWDSFVATYDANEY